MPPNLLALEGHFFSTAVPPSLTSHYAEQLRIIVQHAIDERYNSEVNSYL
ncbi:hypothetical protein N657DRAFT_680302 [Parathielavia appendiculata]|uniref:Uncharacterized protein n=1 Tax=Parathielavia appendiculata TaxID=2587402 RepID=A0AAN6U169_9PEZI|nr:hypothetical protein N657DRAFT_680302 [Parathielavia appendiculata]